MAWVGGGWTITTCPDILCEHVNAWRIQELHTEPVSPGPGGSEAKPPGLRHHRPLRPLAKGQSCARSAAHSGHRRDAAASAHGRAHKHARKHRHGSGTRALAHSCSGHPSARHRSRHRSRHRAHGARERRS